MVFLTKLLQSNRSKLKKTFLDKVRVYVRGGGGGQGNVRYGGHGGRGGHVYVVGDKSTTLRNLIQANPKKRFIASTGANSVGRAIFGEPGEDLFITVPTGIVLSTDGGREIGTINELDDKVLVAKGGVGGNPHNNYLATRGDTLSVTLDLKLIADIGLVGFPNAGKSTLLSALSRATPKIAPYPFTTIQPQLGTIMYDDHRQITVADLPGLIEGASVNIGMGHSFLKHVERTSILLFVVDINGFRLSAKHVLRNALETVLLLNKELELYKEELIDTPAVLALNKLDIPGADDLAREVIAMLGDGNECLKSIEKQYRPKQLIRFDEILTISAKRQHNIDNLKSCLRELLDHYADLEYGEFVKDENFDETLRRQFVERRGTLLV